MGFDYKYGWENMRLAFEIYKKLKGELNVPNSFVVPANDSAWPEELWGMKLGRAACTIRNQGAYKDYKEDLVAMGFDYSPQPIGYGWDNVKRALEVYKWSYGDLLVPAKFTVPKNDSTWPEELWGMGLGKTVSNIRNNNAYDEHELELEAMGFVYDRQKSGQQIKTKDRTSII
jgi:hypothetical protein